MSQPTLMNARLACSTWRSTFWRASLAAIRSEDVVTLRSHLALVEDAFRNATPELRSALCTAYLEQIDFGGRRAMKIHAREMLSPQLSAEVDALKEFWDRQRLQP